jgi:hypothetical protein
VIAAKGLLRFSNCRVMLKAQGLRLNSKIGATLLVTQDGIARSGRHWKRREEPASMIRMAESGNRGSQALFAQPVKARLASKGFHTATVFG